MTYQIGVENHSEALIEDAISALESSHCVLEAANNIIAVGTGFVKLDLSTLTLSSILDTVKRIERKFDRLDVLRLNLELLIFSLLIWNTYCAWCACSPHIMI